MDSIGFIVDRAKLEAKKNIPANLEIVSLWDNDKKRVKEFLVRVDLIDSQKKVLISSELPVARPNNKHISSEARSVTTRMSINLLPLTTAGQYLFKVSQKYPEDKKFNTVAELPLEIKIKYQADIKK